MAEQGLKELECRLEQSRRLGRTGWLIGDLEREQQRGREQQKLGGPEDCPGLYEGRRLPF